MDLAVQLVIVTKKKKTQLFIKVWQGSEKSNSHKLKVSDGTLFTNSSSLIVFDG